MLEYWRLRVCLSADNSLGPSGTERPALGAGRGWTGASAWTSATLAGRGLSESSVQLPNANKYWQIMSPLSPSLASLPGRAAGLDAGAETSWVVRYSINLVMAFLAEKGKMIVHINLICKTHTSVRNTKMWTKTHRILECKILKFGVLLYRLCYHLVTRQTPVATYELHIHPDSSCQGEPCDTASSAEQKHKDSGNFMWFSFIEQWEKLTPDQGSVTVCNTHGMTFAKSSQEVTWVRHHYLTPTEAEACMWKCP